RQSSGSVSAPMFTATLRPAVVTALTGVRSRSLLHGNAAPIVGVAADPATAPSSHLRRKRSRPLYHRELPRKPANRVSENPHNGAGTTADWSQWSPDSGLRRADTSVIARLTPQDADFFRLESTTHPVHIGSLIVLDNTTGDDRPLDYPALVDLVEVRLPLAPRYRRKVRQVP